MNTTAIGQRAELIAAQYLRKHRFQIIDTNWRTRRCEIDIIAYKNSTLYFVEVRYRKTVDFNSALASISHTKLLQMKYAAQNWVGKHNWQQAYTLSVIVVNRNNHVQFIQELYD